MVGQQSLEIFTHSSAVELLMLRIKQVYHEKEFSSKLYTT